MTATIQIDIPVQGVMAHPQTGRDAVMIDGLPQHVVYDVDAAAWRLQCTGDGVLYGGQQVWPTGNGQWAAGNPPAQCNWPVALPGQRRLQLAAPPPVPADAAPLPRRLHFIWIGDAGLPGRLADNLAVNAGRSGLYACTLHAHVETDTGMARLREQLQHSGVAVNDLRADPLLQAFLQSGLGMHYQQLLQPATRNAGAASDLLRVYLLHALGGIYLDCDDTIVAPFPAANLYAAPNDVLLNRWVGAHGLGYFGYNQSCFASQAGNPVLQMLLDEMDRRLGGAADFLQTPRPWKGGHGTASIEGSSALNAYIMRTLELTGPQVFNDVLERYRPDYHGLELWLMHAYRQTTYTPREPRYLANRYFEQMHAALSHYMPFSSGPFEVAIGNADTWNQRPSSA